MKELVQFSQKMLKKATSWINPVTALSAVVPVVSGLFSVQTRQPGINDFSAFNSQEATYVCNNQTYIQLTNIFFSKYSNPFKQILDKGMENISCSFYSEWPNFHRNLDETAGLYLYDEVNPVIRILNYTAQYHVTPQTWEMLSKTMSCLCELLNQAVKQQEAGNLALKIGISISVGLVTVGGAFFLYKKCRTPAPPAGGVGVPLLPPPPVPNV